MADQKKRTTTPSQQDSTFLAGSKSLKTLIKKWDILSSNLSTYRSDDPILLPDLFVISQSRGRTSELVYGLSQYLRTHKNLMEFSGDVRYLEFMLNYCKPGEEFTEIRRLIDEISAAKGFRRDFKGIVHIQIDGWLGHQEESYFLDFLDYLAHNTSNWLVILSVIEGRKKEEVVALETVLSMVLRIEKISLKNLSAETYMKDVEDHLKDYDLELDEEARQLLHKSIEALRKNRYFDSSYTIKLFCRDIVYEVYSRKICRTHLLTAEDVKEFAADSQYIQRTLQKIRGGLRIGYAVPQNKADSLTEGE